MRVCIYQPQYFPRLHYFNRALNSDVFVIMDTAQYTKSLVHREGDETRGKRHKSYQSDTAIKTSAGVFELTVPIIHGGLKPINKTKIDYTKNWTAKHYHTIVSAYGTKGDNNKLLEDIRMILNKKHDSLSDLNVETFLWALCVLLGTCYKDGESLERTGRALKKSGNIRLGKIVKLSELGIARPEGRQKGTEWTLKICEKFAATEYYCGGTAQLGYMDENLYADRGIKVILQNWKCPEYKQKFLETQGHVKNLSILDLLLSEGQEEGVDVLVDK